MSKEEEPLEEDFSLGKLKDELQREAWDFSGSTDADSPVYSELLERMTAMDLEIVCNCKPDVEMWEHPARTCAFVAERLMWGLIWQGGPGRSVLDALSRLPSKVSRPAVFFFAGFAYIVNNRSPEVIRAGQQQNDLLKTQQENLALILDRVEVMARLMHGVGELRFGKSRREFWEKVPESELSKALTQLRLAAGRVQREIDGAVENSQRQHFLKHEAIPRSLREGHYPFLVYQNFESTRHVIQDSGMKRGSLGEAKRVFAAFGIIIDEQAARKARNRSEGGE